MNSTTLNECQKFFKFLYEKYRKNDKVTHIHDTIYDKCMGNLKFFAAFMKVVGHLRANNYPIYGIESTGATINSMKLSTLTITPKFHTNTANYITVQFNLILILKILVLKVL